jgi:hypothetical protein
LITVRGGPGQRVTYDLSLFGLVGGAAGGTLRTWVTDADPGGVIGRQYQRGADPIVDDKNFTRLASDSLREFGRRTHRFVGSVVAGGADHEVDLTRFDGQGR